MTGAIGSGNVYTTNAIYASGAIVVGTALSLKPANLYPGFDNNSTCGTSSSRWMSMYSYNLDIAGNIFNAGSLTVGGTNVNQYMTSSLMTLTPTNPDKPVINPDAYNSLLIYEDGQGAALNSGSLTGSASYGVPAYSTQNCVQLTTATNSTSGSVVWAINPGNSWVLNAEIYAGGGNGAELLAFFVYSSSATGLGSGYSFVVDEYSNINNGNTSKQFSINYNGVPLTTVNGTASGGTFLIPLATWNTLKIVFIRNNVRMYLNNVLVVKFKDISRRISGDDSYYCGFYGQCTTSNNYHAVRNVRLSKHASDGIWSHSDQTSSDIFFAGGNVGINTITSMYSLDVNGAARVARHITASNNRTLPAVANAAVNIAIITSSGNLGYHADIVITQSTANGICAIKYTIPVSFNGTAGAWQRCLPLTQTTTYFSSTVAVDIMISNNTSTLRLVRTSVPTTTTTSAGSTSVTAATPLTPFTCEIQAVEATGSPLTITDDSTASTGVSFASIYLYTPLTTQYGKVGIMTASPAYALDVNGTISATGDVIAFNSTSDRRLKEDIRELQKSGSIIDALRPVDFRWRKDVYHEPVRGKRDIGLVAQEVVEAFPLAHGTKLVYGETIETVDYLKLVPLLLAEVKDLRERIKQQEAKYKFVPV